MRFTDEDFKMVGGYELLNEGLGSPVDRSHLCASIANSKFEQWLCKNSISIIKVGDRTFKITVVEIEDR